MPLFKKIFSGDEFFCLEAYRAIVRSCENPILRPKLCISRSSKDPLPEGNNYILITPEYIHKKADQTFDYIKVGQEYKLDKYLKEKSYLAQFVPIGEFKDLKNTQYSVLAYDLLGFSNSILPFYNNKFVPDVESTSDSIFEFVDYFLGKNWNKILTKYSWVFETQDESYFWMLENTINVCVKIIIGDTNGIHPYRIQKCDPFAKEFGLNGLIQFKKFVCDSITAIRSNDLPYPRIRPFIELTSML